MSKLYRDPKLLDLYSICTRLREDERIQIEAFTGEPFDPEEIAKQHAMKTGAKWLMCNDQEIPVAAAGFDYIRKGVYQDWMIGTDEAWEGHWRAIHKHTRRCMDAMLAKHAHRLQCVSLASRIHAHDWYAVLGLAPEGTLRGYGANGEDFIMFAKGRPD